MRLSGNFTGERAITTVLLLLLALLTVRVSAADPQTVAPVGSAPQAAPNAACGVLFPPACGCDNGNVDGAPGVDAGDFAALVNYCFLNPGAGPINFAGAQIDGYSNPTYGCEPTGGDVLALLDLLFTNFCPADCAQLPPAVGGSGLKVIYNTDVVTFGPGAYAITRQVRLRKTSGSPSYCVGGLSFPVEVQFGGTPPVAVAIVPTVTTTNWPTVRGVVSRPGNRYAGFFYGPLTTLPAGFIAEPLFTLDIAFTVPAGGSTTLQLLPYTGCPSDVPVISRSVGPCPTTCAPADPIEEITLEWANECCLDRTGDVDCSSGVDVGDISSLIDNLFIAFTPLCCAPAGNCDGDPELRVDVSDLTRLIDNLFINFEPLAFCN